MRTLTTLSFAVLLFCTSGCALNKPVTSDNLPQGKIAVYATKVVDATNSISTAAKKLEAVGTLPTAQAAGVIKTAAEIDTEAVKLADLLALYDSMTNPAAQRNDIFTKVQAQLTRIGNLASVLLVPIADAEVRGQIATLVGTLNQTLITLSMEMAKGVK